MTPYPSRFPSVTFAAIEAELTREAGYRARVHAREVERGRMDPQQLARERQLIEAWRADCRRLAQAMAPIAQGKPALYPGMLAIEHSLTLKARRDGLLRELRLREQVYPREIAQGRLDPAAAHRQTERLQCLLAFYDDGLDWPTDPAQRAALYAETMERLHPSEQKELAL